MQGSNRHVGKLCVLFSRETALNMLIEPYTNALKMEYSKGDTIINLKQKLVIQFHDISLDNIDVT